MEEREDLVNKSSRPYFPDPLSSTWLCAASYSVASFGYIAIHHQVKEMVSHEQHKGNIAWVTVSGNVLKPQLLKFPCGIVFLEQGHTWPKGRRRRAR